MLILIFASGFSNQGPLGSIFRTSSLIDRFYSWKIGIEMFKDNLFFGVGLDSYGDWYPFYRTQEIIDFRGLPPEITSFNPHNSLISAASGGGLILLISYIGINIFILFCGLRAIRFQENKFRTSVIFVFWVLFQIQTLISIDSHGISVWGWFVAGILVKLSYNQSEQLKSSKTGNKSLTRMLLIAIFIIVQAPSLYMLNYYSYNVRHLNLLNSFNKKMDVVTFNNNLNNLLILDSRIYQAEINDVTLRLLASLKREDLALEVAIDMTQKYPRRLNGWDAVARIYEFQGKYIEARPYRLKTIELDPLNKVYKSKLVS
jgi:hypothetical protein